MNHFKALAKNPVFWVTLVYLFLPIDLIPDALPIAGMSDDVVLFVLSSLMQSKISRRSAPQEQQADHVYLDATKGNKL